MVGEPTRELRLTLPLSESTLQRLEDLQRERGSSSLEGIVQEAIERYLQLQGKKDVAVLARLTPRQHEVLRLIAEGHKTREIAHRLNISVKTVEMHRAQLMEALDLHNIVEVVRFAVRTGVVNP
jgi:DNA-binding NarL/FixJ family response regulator